MELVDCKTLFAYQKEGRDFARRFVMTWTLTEASSFSKKRDMLSVSNRGQHRLHPRGRRMPMHRECLDFGLKRMWEEENSQEFFFYTIQDPPLREP